MAFTRIITPAVSGTIDLGPIVDSGISGESIKTAVLTVLDSSQIPLPVSGVTPFDISIPQPLQVSGIVALSQIPVPVSGIVQISNATTAAFPLYVAYSGVSPGPLSPIPVSSVVPQSVSVSIPQPLQVSGILSVQNIINVPIPVSSVYSAPSTTTIIQPLTIAYSGVTSGSLSPLPVSGVSMPPVSVSIPIPLTVSGIVSLSPQPLPTTVSGILQTFENRVPLPISGIAGYSSVAITNLPSVQAVSGITGYSSVTIAGPLPLPVSGVYIQPVGASQLPLPQSVGGILETLVYGNQLAPLQQTGGGYLLVSGVGQLPISGITGYSTINIANQPIAVSGITGYSSIAVSGITGYSPPAVQAVSGITGYSSVSITGQPIAVSSVYVGLTPISGIVQISNATTATFPLYFAYSGVSPGILSPLPVSSVSQPAVSVSIPQPLQISGIVGISPLPIPVSGVSMPPTSVSIPQPLQVSGIVAVLQDTSPWVVSGITGYSPPAVQTVSGITGYSTVGITGTIATSGVVAQEVVPFGGTIPSGILPISLVSTPVTQPTTVTNTVAVSGVTSQEVSIMSPLNPTGYVQVVISQVSTASGGVLTVSGVSRSQIGLADNIGNAFQPYIGGLSNLAPGNGIWHFVSQVPTVSGVFVGPSNAGGFNLTTFIWPTVSGISYTFELPISQGIGYGISGTVRSGWIGGA